MACIDNVNISFYYLDEDFHIVNQSEKGHSLSFVILVMNNGNSIYLRVRCQVVFAHMALMAFLWLFLIHR